MTVDTMEIKQIGSQPSGKGPSEYFTGTVRVDPLFSAPDPARVAGASVTFEPGARTAWHTHPLGQTLIVTAGCGWSQREGGPVEVIRPGDVVWFSPGEKHWHGATATTAMTHIAIQERLDGKFVDWMEQVSDEQYRKRRSIDAGLMPFSPFERFKVQDWDRTIAHWAGAFYLGTFVGLATVPRRFTVSEPSPKISPTPCIS
jgi:quercetin dioxygenase-like cupin family protein